MKRLCDFGLPRLDLRLQAKSNEFTVWIDGEEVLTFADRDMPFLDGTIGLSGFNAYAHYGELKVTDLGSQRRRGASYWWED